MNKFKSDSSDCSFEQTPKIGKKNLTLFEKILYLKMEYSNEFVDQLIEALKHALPCVEYAEIETGAQGLTSAHEKCLAALDHIKPLLNRAKSAHIK